MDAAQRAEIGIGTSSLPRKKTLYCQVLRRPICSKRKKLGKRGGEMFSTRHEKVYHATHGCQAASLSLTAPRLRGLFWACQVESHKNAGFLAHVERDQHDLELLRGFACMLPLRLLEGGALTALSIDPRGDGSRRPHC